VTEESEGSSTVPGSSAGDAAPTQAIPRIPKPANGTATPPPPAKKAPARPTSRPAPARKPVAGAETDKGRPRQAPAPSDKPAETTPVATKAAEPRPAESKPAATKAAEPRPAAGRSATEPSPTAARTQQRNGEPIGGPTGRTLTAADYARTTKDSPATTAVIPAVKDTPPPKGKSKRESPAATLAPAGTGRRASLRLTHIEPWSVTRLAFAISVAMMIVSVVAVLIFWLVLDAVGVWDQINDSFTTVLSDDSDSFNVTDYFGFGRVVGLTLVLSAVNVIVMTALATIAAHLYNLSARLMGGVEMTFAEDK
jgi:hypothetical protein